MAQKKLSIKVRYKEQEKTFVCEKHELDKEISSYFKINLRDILMFKIEKDEKHPISLHDITDLMTIEIIPHRNGLRSNTLSLELESKKMLENIKTKLQQNSAFNDQERKVLIEAFEVHGTSIFKRPKSDQIAVPKPELVSKKLQVNIEIDEDDVGTQTEPCVLPFEDDSFFNNEDDGEDAMITLKRWNGVQDVPREVINSLMEKTYDRRRNFIHTGPPVSVVKEQWPALFCVEQVKKELDRLFYPGKYEEFLDNMTIYTKHILHYKDSKIDDILKTVDKARSQARTAKQKAYAQTVGSIFVLATLLDENFGFIHLSDQPHSSSNLFPYIDASSYSLQKVFFDGIIYHIIVEGEHMCEASDFPEAILCLMATFFIFNIDYPDSCRRTLTVLEKVYLKGNDTQEMDDMTQQWIKLLTMKEMRKRKREKEKEKEKS